MENAPRSTDQYGMGDSSDETGILWSDKDLNIDWPININDAVVSEKDQNFKPLFGKNS